MRHPAIRQVFDHWDRQRGSQAAPDRDAIDPGAIRSALADTFILAGGPGRPALFRLAGTRVCALFCRELKGEDFVRLWHTASREELDVMLASVAEDRVGVVGAATAAASEAPAAGGGTAHVEFLLLPLRHDGHIGSRMLGALAISGPVPYWSGARPASQLMLEGFRFVGAHIDPRRPLFAIGPQPRPFERILTGPALHLKRRFARDRLPPPPPGDSDRRRRNFIVYDGGRQT